MKAYLTTLCERFGNGWNRFWYTPSDPYVLSIVRVLIGLLATYTVALYSFDLDRLLGPSGMLPVEMLRRLPEDYGGRFSYLDYVRSTNELWLLHIVGLGVLVAFTAGWYTRLTAVLATFVLLSYIQRGGILINSYVEHVLAFVMVYLCIGPAGAYFSVDRWLATRKAGSTARPPVPLSYAANISQRLIQIHTAVVVAMMALIQIWGQVWWNGTAVWWLIANPQDSLIDLQWLSNSKVFVNFWTHSILAFELCFPVLIWNRLARPLLLAIGLVIWTSVAIVTGMVSFAAAMFVASLSFALPDALRSLCACSRREIVPLEGDSTRSRTSASR